MRKICVVACAFALSGCAWLGFGGDDAENMATAEPQPAAQEEVQAAEPTIEAPAAKVPEKAKTRKAAKNAKNVKSEAQIKEELDKMGNKLASQSARTLLPNKSKPDYKQVGKEWVASYIDVDMGSVTTEMRPSSNGQYIGFVRYQERFMECRGASKQQAIANDCQVTKTRNLNELIHYDGKAWQD